jgi:hypothetical protein
MARNVRMVRNTPFKEYHQVRSPAAHQDTHQDESYQYESMNPFCRVRRPIKTDENSLRRAAGALGLPGGPWRDVHRSAPDREAAGQPFAVSAMRCAADPPVLAAGDREGVPPLRVSLPLRILQEALFREPRAVGSRRVTHLWQRHAVVWIARPRGHPWFRWRRLTRGIR